MKKQDLLALMEGLVNKPAGAIEAGQYAESHCQPVILRTYTENSQNVVEVSCCACGNNTVVPRAYGYGYRNSECSTCGNSNSIHSEHSFVFVEKNSEVYNLYCYKIKCNLPDSNLGAIGFDITLNFVGYFDDFNGLSFFDIRNKKSTNSPSHIAYRDMFNACKDTIDNISDFKERYDKYIAKKSEANKVKKGNSRSHLVEEMRLNYKAKVVDTNKLVDAGSELLSYLESDKDDLVIRTICPVCNESWVTICEKNSDGNIRIHMVCPSCKKEAYVTPRDVCRPGFFSRCSGINRVLIYENTNLPDNDLLIRDFSVSVSPLYQEAKLQVVVKELSRWFYTNTDRFECHAESLDTFVKTRYANSKYRHYRYYNELVAQSPDEIRSIIEKSSLSHSGLVEAYGIGDSRYIGCDKLGSSEYLDLWCRNHSIELVLKANMIRYIKDVKQNPRILDAFGQGSTLSEVLGVTPYVARIAAKQNLSSTALAEFAALNKNRVVSWELYEAIRNAAIPASSLLLLESGYNISLESAMNYLQNVYDHQCIDKNEALYVWVDYLRMATNLKLDLSSKNRKYPTSLKKEHDIAMFADRALKTEIDEKQFAEQAELNKFYEYSYKDLVAIVPQTPQDILEEASRQGNCLRSYISSVKRGETVVVFVRKKDTPDETLYTAEIRGGVLTQFKGFHNSNPRSKQISEFVSHWAKKCAIRNTI